MISKKNSIPAISGIVGAKGIRPAGPSDAIAGVQPQYVVEPTDYEQTAAVLRYADSTGLKVAPRGAGTKLDWGNPPKALDLVLSTARLNQVREHAWSDMTATVEAGSTVANFQRILAEHGQRLALDPLFADRATIGGILAVNDSGSLRLRFGALRDLIIGISVALPDGTVARSGGKVVKNVAGYDLAKLYTGSQGTLGIILDATFRLYPVPAGSKCVTLAAPEVDAANRLLLATLASTLTPAGLQMRASNWSNPGADEVQVDAWFEGTAEVLDVQEKRFLALAPMGCEAFACSDPFLASQRFFENADASVIAKFSVRPSHLAKVCEAVSQKALDNDLKWSMVAQATGIGVVRLDGPAAQTRNAAIDLRSDIKAIQGSVVILKQPPPASDFLEAWGDPGDSITLMQRVKHRFDPNSTLNSGRFVGGI